MENIKNAKVIGVDFDDVIMQTNKAMALWHNRVYGTSYKREDVYTYDLTKIWRCTHEEMAQRIREFYYSAEHAEITPFDSAVESLKLLGDKELHVITARRQEHRDITFELVNKHAPFLVPNFHFPNANTSKRLNTSLRKSEICMEIGVEVFIDDHLTYALDVASVGIPVFLFNAPWNQTNDLPHNVIRVGHWDEILEEFV